MKYFSCLLIMILLIIGCNTFESDSNQTFIKDIDVVDVELSPGQEFIFKLASLGDEEQAVIKEGSLHALVSELFYEFDGAVFVKYRYQPEKDFIGKDTVVLEVRRGSDGSSPNTDIYYTVLRFNIKPS